ncbi:chemotaxis protein CheB [Xylophilus sp.]|uniref:chemotaxis protein CheB n=1 Tax=Xylophilus sp. TaxID=2653893 RepID=UPI0013B70347|nr:chemotaxis protein CheB [Xylophilus sp.]KAF1045926.1 MAG: Sensor histidine kinase TmoS [Xylophilus sp.]
MSVTPDIPAPPFDVLGIVASAGGLEAISAVLADLEPGFGAAVVVGQHLGGESGLVDILARRISLPVVWASDGMALQAGRVHVMPPRTSLEVHPDHSCAIKPTADGLWARTLDILLQSLADSFASRSMALVLTGMGSDGAAGARAVKNAGGAVIAQSEKTADHPDMPRAAVLAGAVDLVLPLREIGPTVSRIMGGGRFPQPRTEQEARRALFDGPGPARQALRAVAWESSALGQVLHWPAALKAVAAAMLGSGFGTCIAWGPDFSQLYNDAWIGVLGSKHPGAAGTSSHVTWREHWPSLAATYRRVLETSQTSYVEDFLLELRRHGYTEEAYVTLSCSPLADDSGAVRGVMTIATETTPRVLAERRLVALRALTSAVAGAETVTEVCRRAEQLLAEQSRDLPFVLLYRIDDLRQRATLAAASGVAAGSAFAPYTVDLQVLPAAWPLGRVARQGEPLRVDDLPARLPAFHAGPWPEPPTSAMLLPVRVEGEALGAVLVAGLSPRIGFDRSYQDFVGQLAQQLGASLTDARLRESARERLHRLAELDRTKTEFFSNVSHEFRTPLTLILAPLEDVQMHAAASVALRCELEVAARNAKRLLNLVDTLLDFSQIEAGRLRAQFEMVDLAALTRDVAGLFRSAAERLGVALHVDCPPLSAPVPVDRQMWEQIVSNLLANALKHTFEGSVTVGLAELGQHVQLTVADTGVGIPEDELDNVFMRFHRVRGMRSRTDEGVGIGLAMVHGMVQLHRGRVRVRSRPGRGSTFTVWLNRTVAFSADRQQRQRPARNVALQLAREADRWAAPQAGAVAAAGVMESVLGPARPEMPARVPHARVLVVDDNADMRDYLARVLGLYWDVVVAHEGEEALALARSQRPDLVLTDVMMPGLDGFGLLRRLREDDELKATPVVLVTARAHEQAAIDGLLAGADDYVAKPFASRELVARIGAQLELARVRRHGERQVRELLALMPVAVYACDRDGRFEIVNRRVIELWGAEPGRDDRAWALRGGPRVRWPDGHALVAEEAPMVTVLASGQSVVDQELVIVQADGKTRDILVNIRPLHDADGHLVGAVSAFLDVTERKRAERALQTMTRSWRSAWHIARPRWRPAGRRWRPTCATRCCCTV